MVGCCAAVLLCNDEHSFIHPVEMVISVDVAVGVGVGWREMHIAGVA